MAIILLLVISSNFIGALGDVQFNATVAVVKGQSIRLPCTNDKSNETIHWYYYSLDNPKQTIVYNGEEMSPHFVKRFATDTKGPGQYDLIVNYAKLTDAGTYECFRHIPSSDRPDRIKPIILNAIQLTVLDNYPLCSFSTNSSTITNGYVVESDFISLTCSFNYSGSSRPVIKWLRKGHDNSLDGIFQRFPISSNLNLFEATSKIFVHVNGTDKIILFTCVASFSTVQHLESTTSNSEVSDHHFQCDLTFSVAYAVRNIRISPNSSQYSIENQLNCSADGTPNPKYEWRNLVTSEVIQGPILTVNKEMATNSEYTWQCKAYNKVAGETKSVAKSITFTVIEKSRFPFFTVTILMGIIALILMIIAIYLGKEPIKDLVARLRPSEQVVPDIEPDVLPNAVGCQRAESRDQEYVGYAQPEDIVRALNSMAIVVEPEFPVYASIDDTLQGRNSLEMKGGRMPCDGKAEESGPSTLKHPKNTEFPVYADVNKDKKEMKSDVKPKLESSVSNASAKADCGNMIVAADGTEYMDMNTVRSQRQIQLSVSAYEDPLFSKSVYAYIDHSASPPPPPKED